MLLDLGKYNNSQTGSIENGTLPKKQGRKKNKTIHKNLSTVDHSSDKLNSKDIIRSLNLRFLNHDYVINNAYIFKWESDFFSISEAGYIYEVEVKISREDFKSDFNKVDKHKLLESTDSNDFIKIPNKFFYAVPKGLLKTFEVPEYAGLIEVNSPTEMATVVKEAPFLHKTKIFEKYKNTLLQKFYWRYRDLLAKTGEILTD